MNGLLRRNFFGLDRPVRIKIEPAPPFRPMTHEEFGATRIPSALLTADEKSEFLCLWRFISKSENLATNSLATLFLALGFLLHLKFILAETRKKLIESLILYLLVSLRLKFLYYWARL
jgi:hypothetical protein